MNNKIFIFGGIGSTVNIQNECLQDMVVLNLDNWSWSTPLVSGTLPHPRFVHRMVAVRSKLLLFGGRTSNREKFNDVHIFDPDTMCWSKEEQNYGRSPFQPGWLFPRRYWRAGLQLSYQSRKTRALRLCLSVTYACADFRHLFMIGRPRYSAGEPRPTCVSSTACIS